MNFISNRKNILKSIIFLVLGALLVAYANQVVTLLSIVLGISLIGYGIILTIVNYYETKSQNNTSSATLVFGILSIIFGILFIILADSISQFIQYVLGALILYMGIEKLITALMTPKIGKHNTSLIIAILIMLAGLYTILVSHIEVQIVGILLMIYSILEIVDYVSIKKVKHDISNEEEKVDTKKIKHNNVKEAKVIEEKKK